MNENDLERERKQQLEDVKKIASTPEGRRLFRRMINEGFVFECTFTGNSSGFFREGHRRLALIFLNDLKEVCPEQAKQILFDEQLKKGVINDDYSN